VNGKVLLVVIDAATPHVVCPAIQTGRLPVMQKLAEAGVMHQSSVSIFPSITPAATSTIITGAYPAEHGIAAHPGTTPRATRSPITAMTSGSSPAKASAASSTTFCCA